MIKLNDMLKSEAETTQAELTKWLKVNGEELKVEVAENSEAITKFKQKLKKAAEQANTDVNKEVANQATKLSTMLDEVAVALDSVSKELEKK